jgi:hypothetical protein
MTSLNVPNAITNGTIADATDVQQNFDAVETHVNTEVVNRDGSIAMTGELLLPSNPTSNLAASTKSYVDGLDNAMDSRVAALEGKDIVVTLTGDVTGTGTITNLGDVSFVTTVVDDLHNHTIANVDGLQTALNAKLDSSSYTASDVLTKIKTVDGAGSGLDADTLDGISSGSFLRSNASDTMDGNLTMATGRVIKFEGSTNDADELTLTCVDPTTDRTITFPNATGTVALTSSDITGNAATATYATSAGSAGSATSATSAGYATSAGNADTVDGYEAASFWKIHVSSSAPSDTSALWIVP